MARSDGPQIDSNGDEIIPDPADALEFEPIRRTRPKRGKFVWLMVVLIAGAGVGAGWYYFGDKIMTGKDGEIPLIRAAETPVKVRPENPGGMAIPDRDKLVYDRMKGEDSETSRIERLLPQPEQPLAPPAQVKEPEPVPEPPVQVAEQTPAAPEPEPAPFPEPAPAPAPQPAPVPEPLTKAEQADIASTVAGLAYRVQLAAVRSEVLAENEWDRLKKKHPDLLGPYSLSVVRIDLGADKGIYYRLRAGPLPGEEQAKALCENLIARKVACLIVRPGG